MIFKSFAGVTLPTYNREAEFGAGFGSGLVPTTVGAYDRFGADQVRSPQRIPVSFEVVASGGNTLQENLDALLAALATSRGLLVATDLDGNERQTFAKAVNVRYSSRPGLMGRIPVTCEFELPDPTWYRVDDEPTYLNNTYEIDASDVFDIGTYLLDAEEIPDSPLTGTVNVDYQGTIATRKMFIILKTGASTTVVGFQLTNATTGHFWKYNATLAANSELWVVPHLERVTVNNDNSAYDVTQRSSLADLFLLTPGTNTLNWEFTSMGSTNPTYLYIQASRAYPA